MNPARRAKIGSLAKSLNEMSLSEGLPAEAAVSLMKASNALDEVSNRDRVLKPTDDKVANESHRKAMEAQARAAELEAEQHATRAEELTESMLHAPSDLAGYYSARIQEYRRKSSEAHGRAESIRNGIAASGL